MKTKWKTLILCILIPLAIGAISAFFTADSMSSFDAITKPPFSPPGVLFPIVWTILFVLMGIASYLVYASSAPKTQKDTALTVYGLQLAVNFFWSLIFFNLNAYLFAFFWLLLLLALIAITIIKFRKISPVSALLLLPYLLWVTFAGYLNLAIYFLN